MVITEHRVKKCPECGKEFYGRYVGRAYAGHMWLSHFKRVGVRGKIVALEQEVTNLKTYIAKLEGRCSSQEVKLGQATKPLVIDAGSHFYEWKYCPECGKPRAKHRAYTDLIYGKGWECPGGGRYKG